MVVAVGGWYEPSKIFRAKEKNIVYFGGVVDFCNKFPLRAPKMAKIALFDRKYSNNDIAKYITCVSGLRLREGLKSCPTPGGYRSERGVQSNSSTIRACGAL